MISFNKVILAGNLVSDVEVVTLPSTAHLAKFTIAVNKTLLDKDKNKKKITDFVDCTAFGSLADVIAKFFKKGRPILVEGSLRQEKWKDKDGSNRSKLTVAVDNFSFADSGSSDNNDNSNKGTATKQQDNGIDEDQVPF